jgi:asparagine synthase (glutamine-hydrolysing)
MPIVKACGGFGFLDGVGELPGRKLNYLRDHVLRFRNGALLENGYERFFLAVTISSPAVRARIYETEFWLRHEAHSTFAHRVAETFPREARQPLSPLEQFMLGDLTVHMPASLLQRLDRSSMAHSLEARVPFLSHRFVDWALTVPSELKMRRGVGKYLLRQAVKPWLPASTPKARKLGFQMPLADWFVGGFSDFAFDAWTSSGAADEPFLNRFEVQRLFDEHRRGLANHGRLLYALAMFGCWWKEQRRPQRRPQPQRQVHPSKPEQMPAVHA